MSELLFEIGTEELPAGFLQPALQQLKDNFCRKAKDLKIGHEAVQVMGTPRRLALLVENMVDRQPDSREELLGPSVKAGMDSDGKPTKAAEGFARSKGASVEDLKVVTTPKGEYLVLIREVKGKPTEELLPELCKQLLLELSFPKSMRWGSNQNTFARPIQWMVALNDSDIIDFSHDGIKTSNISMGHRFMANEEIILLGRKSYEEQLNTVHVIVDPIKRREMVVQEVKNGVVNSDDLTNADVFIDDNLVDTVTNLVEYPFGVCGRYNDKFLDLPDDVLITSMREHQKYFPVIDEGGKLLSGFVAVNNTKVTDTAVTKVGHERVLRARLEDALFFFNSDKETTLEDRISKLSGIIFQAKLGSMLDKNERVVKLARMIAEKIAPSTVEDCVRAAQICKADLLTDMVGEFPSLQGVMGEAYARHEGENDSVALAIREHYMPKRAGAELPSSTVGAIVGLADRLDTLAGCFGIGQIPTGTADPFGLRRLSLAVLHIIDDSKYTLSLEELFHKALALYGDKVDGSAKTVETVVGFVKGRYVNDCIAKGLYSGAVEGVTSVNFDDVNDCSMRIEAFIAMKNEEAFSVLASSFKRIRNIVKDNSSTDVDETLFQEKAEESLFTLFKDVSEQMQKLITQKNYLQALEVLLKMKEPIDTFFDEVMVMAEDIAVRQNRLNLLTAMGELVLQVGDISKMNES